MAAKINRWYKATYTFSDATQTWFWRFLIATLTILLIFLIAPSQMYLNVHYLSSVLGAMAAAMARISFCYTTVETLRRYCGSFLSGALR